MERIGIFGGTFNPPHVGHIESAKQAVAQLQLDKLLFVPAHIAPNKQGALPGVTDAQRLDMLKIAAREVPNGEVCDVELRREGVSYTYETILELKKAYPQAEFVLLMGSDVFLRFDQWVNAQLIAENATLGIFYRGGKNEIQQVECKKAELAEKKIRGRVIDSQILDVSSSQMRRMLAFSCAKPFLPRGVYDYIQENGLYDTHADFKNLPMEEMEPLVVRLLKANRVAHVLGCRDTAVQMAKHWGADVTDAARAGILHDITKALDGPLQLTLCREYGTILDEFSHRYPKTLHALTGSLVAREIFGENDAVVSAIEHHTTGRAGMSLLEKIIYIADYIEPNRTLPYVEELRYLAYTDIDAAVKLGLEKTLEHLATLGDEISPATKAALDYLNT